MDSVKQCVEIMETSAKPIIEEFFEENEESNNLFRDSCKTRHSECSEAK